MGECDNCGRKFFFEQLVKHRKNCELINGKMGLGKAVTSKKQANIIKPKFILCVICGREYGTASIVIHTGNCE